MLIRTTLKLAPEDDPVYGYHVLLLLTDTVNIQLTHFNAREASALRPAFINKLNQPLGSPQAIDLGQ